MSQTKITAGSGNENNKFLQKSRGIMIRFQYFACISNAEENLALQNFDDKK